MTAAGCSSTPRRSARPATASRTELATSNRDVTPKRLRRPAPSPIAPGDAVPIGCVAGDYDNDGRTDLFVLRYGVSSLYHNDGDGRFTDVTSSAAITPYPFLPGAAALVDVDHDGDLDIVIAG